MNKIKNFIKNIFNWISTDGLLHLLVCYSLMITLLPLVGVWWSLLITTVIAIAKEAWDYFYEKDNNLKQVLHDVICDAGGLILSLLTMLLWNL